MPKTLPKEDGYEKTKNEFIPEILTPDKTNIMKNGRKITTAHK